MASNYQNALIHKTLLFFFFFFFLGGGGVTFILTSTSIKYLALTVVA